MPILNYIPKDYPETNNTAHTGFANHLCYMFQQKYMVLACMVLKQELTFKHNVTWLKELYWGKGIVFPDLFNHHYIIG